MDFLFVIVFIFPLYVFAAKDIKEESKRFGVPDLEEEEYDEDYEEYDYEDDEDSAYAKENDEYNPYI